MTFTRSTLMMKRYLDGKLTGFGPVNCKPTRLKLAGCPPKSKANKNGKRYHMPFCVVAIVVDRVK